MSSPQGPGREELSSFMDGEMESDRIDELVSACCKAGELREDWTVYHCIGDVLRSEDMAIHSGRLASAISTRLADEPFVVAVPRRPAAHVSIRRAASLAAAVAGVAVVTYIAQTRWNGADGNAPQLAGATAPAISTAPAVPPVAAVAAPAVSREFLAAHRQYSGGIAMQGMVGQVRNVALESGR